MTIKTNIHKLDKNPLIRLKKKTNYVYLPGRFSLRDLKVFLLMIENFFMLKSHKKVRVYGRNFPEIDDREINICEKSDNSRISTQSKVY